MNLLRYKKSLCAILVIVALFCDLLIQVKREFGYVCRNTASRKHYTTWLGLFESDKLYEKSPIEEYLESKKVDWEHDWASCNGTGKNILGHAVLFAHGRPGAVLGLDPRIFSIVRMLSDLEKQEIYEVLKAGDQKAIELKVLALYDRMFKLEP